MKVKRYEGEWSSCSDCFPAEKNQWHQFNRRLCGPQDQSGHFREEKNVFALLRFEHHTTQPLVVCKKFPVPSIEGSSYIVRLKNIYKISLR